MLLLICLQCIGDSCYGSWTLLACLGTSLLDIRVCLGLALLVGDSSCWCGESAMTSARLSDASVLDSVDLSSLDIGGVLTGN